MFIVLIKNKRVRKYICYESGRVFNDRTNTFFNNLCKDEDDGAWMWMSFAPESRLIIDFILGPRKQSVADELIKATGKHLSDSKPLFSLAFS